LLLLRVHEKLTGTDPQMSFDIVVTVGQLAKVVLVVFTSQGVCTNARA